jgi:hypothetical protein
MGGTGESLWRWALRLVGMGSFILSGVLLVSDQEVPVVFLVIGAGMMGLDSIQGLEFRRRERSE